MPQQLCGARTKNGGTCRNPAGFKTDHVGFGHCAMHSGATPNGEKRGRRLMAEQAVATYGLPREVSAHQALAEELFRTAGHVAWLAEEVRKLEREDVSGPVGGGENPRYEPNVLVRMLLEERKHLLDVSKTCVAVGIEERKVELAEQTAQTIALVIRLAAQDLGIADDPRLPDVIRRRLTEAASM